MSKPLRSLNARSRGRRGPGERSHRTALSAIGEIVAKRVNRPGTNQVDREWTDLRTANETAAQNWLALGQYLSIKKQYPQSRATYQRVIDTYTGATERTYREQAARAIRDLDLLSPPPAARER